jgi:hypothetical protein
MADSGRDRDIRANVGTAGALSNPPCLTEVTSYIPGYLLAAHRIGWAAWGRNPGISLDGRHVAGQRVVNAPSSEALGLPVAGEESLRTRIQPRFRVGDRFKPVVVG